MGNKKHDGTTAFHAQDESGHVVGIGNLKVLIKQDDGVWFAQGLDIDYFAEGESLEDAQKSFQSGLSATIQEHIKVYGGIQKLLVVAPYEAWEELLQSRTYHVHSQIKCYEVGPFSGIDFLTESEEAA